MRTSGARRGRPQGGAGYPHGMGNRVRDAPIRARRVRNGAESAGVLGLPAGIAPPTGPFAAAASTRPSGQARSPRRCVVASKRRSAARGPASRRVRRRPHSPPLSPSSAGRVRTAATGADHELENGPNRQETRGGAPKDARRGEQLGPRVGDVGHAGSLRATGRATSRGRRRTEQAPSKRHRSERGRGAERSDHTERVEEDRRGA